MNKKNKYNLLLLFSSVFITFLLIEFIYSFLFVSHNIFVKTIWFHEATDSVNNVRFDPNIGYRISSVPARFGAVLSNGHLESIGILKGNNYGFPDKRDFNIKKQNPKIKRIAVLGDSFTASQFTHKSWVERMEEKWNSCSADSILLMNFSVDGGGLANWCSIVKNIILKQGFELDGIIFAVMGNDLDRKFMWAEDWVMADGSLKYAINYDNSWNPENYPTQKDQLSPYFLETYYILSTNEVNAIEEGNWVLEKPLKPYLSLMIIDILRETYYKFRFPKKRAVDEGTEMSSQYDKLLLIQDLAKNCRQINVPILTLSFMTEHKKTASFAKLINSSYTDDKAFQKWLLTEPDSIVIEGDGHWNQKGVDGFSEIMFPYLKTWIQEEIINHRK